MNTLARAVAWQTRLLEQAVSDDGLTREDAERAFATLDQLAAVFEATPVVVSAASDAMPALHSDMVAVVDAALRAGELVQGGDQRIHVISSAKPDAGWFDLDRAIERFCPPIIWRQLRECESQFERAGGESKSSHARAALRYLSPQEQDRYRRDWQELWCEWKCHLRPDEILIFMLKHARDAQYQIAADAVGQMLREGSIIAQSLGGAATPSGWQPWPSAEWRRHRIVIVETDEKPDFEIVSADTAIRIPADRIQFSLPAGDGSASDSKERKKGGAPTKKRWAEAAAHLAVWLQLHDAFTERGDQAAAVQHIMDNMPNEWGEDNTSELKTFAGAASRAMAKAKQHPPKG